MRIALDASCLASNGRGFARYVQALLLGLAARLPAEDVLLTYSDRGIRPELIPERFRTSLRILPPRRFHALWRRQELVAAAKADRTDLLHFPDNAIADCRPLPAVVTLHDISPLLMPERRLASPLMRLYFSRAVASIRKGARLVIADSQASAKDLASYWAGRHPPLRIVSPGLCPLPSPAPAAPPGTPYFLFVGTLEARKNLPGLLAGFSRFKAATRLPHRLLLVGEAPRGFGVVAARMREAPGVERRGRLPDAALPALYRDATAFAMPSWYEAFGFPYLEAMAYDCPVLGTTAGSGPEVIGDAGLLANPADPEAISSALTRLATEPALRGTLVRKGRERVGRFTVEAMAEGTLAAYREAVS